MHARVLLAASAVVLAGHAALLLALASHGSTATAAGVAARPLPRLVLVGSRPDAAHPDPLTLAAPQSVRAAHPARIPPAGSRAAEDDPAPSPAKPAAPALPASSIGIGIYRAASALDAPVRTRSAPDMAQLVGLPWSGMPLRIRLFIDAQGAVVATQVLQSSEADDVVDRVRRMFLATGFTAGTQGGLPVPSYKDIELTIGVAS